MNEPRVIPVGTVLAPMENPKPRPRPDAPPAGRGDGRSAPPPKRTAGRGAAIKKRFSLLNGFADRAMATLTRAEIAAWVGLYRHAAPDGTVCASVGDLARRGGCSERAMRTALADLRRKGLLKRLKRGTLAGGPSVWRLGLPELPE